MRKPALLAVAAALVASTALTGACTRSLESTDRPSTESVVSAPAERKLDRTEKAALKMITGARAYDPAMNARVLLSIDERLQPGRLPGMMAVVRIEYRGVPVDLYFVRRTGSFKAMAVGTRGGDFDKGYDRMAALTGDDVLAFVDKYVPQQ